MRDGQQALQQALLLAVMASLTLVTTAGCGPVSASQETAGPAAGGDKPFSLGFCAIGARERAVSVSSRLA